MYAAREEAPASKKYRKDKRELKILTPRRVS